jgi:hypothetical protein
VGGDGVFLLPVYEFRRRKFFGRGADPGFDVFAGVFEGCFEKYGVWRWFFDGEIVVICMVNVVEKT